MSTSTENTSPGMCDQVLDYAYDELAGEAKTAFEAHLQTCQKCQAELAQLKRVRGAVKAVLPSVEPPANATGALHAQLLHAAAQRAGGGKVIPFGRKVQKVILSPAFLAAAMFLIVGGAAGTMWYRGHLMMPERAAEAPAPAAAPVTATAEVPPADETTVKAEAASDAPKAKEKDVAGGAGYYRNAFAADKKGSLAGEGAESENKVFLGGLAKDSAPMPVRRAPAMHAASGSAGGASAGRVAAEKPMDAKTDLPAKKAAPEPAAAQPAPRAMSSGVKTRETNNAALDGLSDDVATGGTAASTRGGQKETAGEVLSTESVSNTRSRRDQAVAPAKPAVAKAPKREESGPQGGGWNGNVSSLPAQATSAPAPSTPPAGNLKSSKSQSAAPAAPPPPPMEQQIDGKMGGKSSNADNTWRNTAPSGVQSASPVATPAAQQQIGGAYARNNDALRKQALSLADAGRCADSVRLYDQLQKDRVTLSTKEQAAYKRCKTRLDEAAKQDRNVQNRMMQDAERVNEEAPPARVASPKPAPPETQTKAASKGKKRSAPAGDSPAASPAEAKPGL